MKTLGFTSTRTFLAAYDPSYARTQGFTTHPLRSCTPKCASWTICLSTGSASRSALQSRGHYARSGGRYRDLSARRDRARPGPGRGKQGRGAIKGQATTLAHNLYGFELMVGPYSVAELRVSRALHDRGAQLPADGTQVYLTDTLDDPHAKAPELPQFLRPNLSRARQGIAGQEGRAGHCLSRQPPYDRHEAATP